MPSLPPELLTILGLAGAQMLAAISPGPSFLITTRTAVVESRKEGVKIALGLSAGTVIWAGSGDLGRGHIQRTLVVHSRRHVFWQEKSGITLPEVENVD